MGLLWVLVVLLILFALIGGITVSGWLFVILLIALILLLVGYV
jgi:hypothetical protein